MILNNFFSYYFKAVDDEVRAFYHEMLPSATDLAKDYAEMFRKNDEHSIAFLLDFYRGTAALRERDPRQAILFNVNQNVCFPFFLGYIWERLNEDDRTKIMSRVGEGEIKTIVQRFDDDLELRNWFRQEIGHNLDQEDLFTMNEVIALQNFSSGGESSFLRFAYPYISQMEGRILDAGCGAGFAALVMSQYADILAVDACRSRLERAIALSEMMKQGEKAVFPGVIQLIQEELGTMAVDYDFPSAAQLLSGNSNTITFHEGSIDCLPCEDNSFDAINCLDVLEHTYSPENIVKEFGRVLKPGGIVLITAPTQYGEVEQHIHESIAGSMFPAMLHMHHFDPEKLSELFARYGLIAQDVVPFDFMSWEQFLEMAERSPARELVEALKAKPFDEVALQLFAVYRKAE